MFSKIIDVNSSEAFVISSSNIIMSIPIDYIGNKAVGEVIFVPAINTSRHSYMDSTRIMI